VSDISSKISEKRLIEPSYGIRWLQKANDNATMGNDCDSKREWTFENRKSNIGRGHQVENQATEKMRGLRVTVFLFFKSPQR
jgi:hypothetical protein